MKWIVVIAILCGFFFLARRLMPSSAAIDVNWMAPQVHVGMTQEQVQQVVAGEPSYRANSGVGKDETWYYNDRYHDNVRLAIQFIDGRVYRTAIETSPTEN